MTSSELRPFTREAFSDMLTGSILPFWRTRMVDNVNSGFYGRIDGLGELHAESPKSIILNTRLLWTFSSVVRITKNKVDRQLADRAYSFIEDHFLDEIHGGVFWMVDFKGQVMETKKQLYAQAFAIYALVEYYRLCQDEQVLKRAIDIYQLVEDHGFDTEENGYFEAFSADWGKLDDVRLSEKDMNASKTMNTHLHILEAYTQLYMEYQDVHLRDKLVNLIGLMTSKFLSDQYHFRLFFNDHWKLLSGSISYGHDIEGSWLLSEAAESIADYGLVKETNQIVIEMTKAAMEGLDTDGGLMNEGDESGVTDHEKHWWPQAEALVGLTNCWQITQKQFFLEKAQMVWQFIQANMLHDSGEWRWKVALNGSVDDSTEDLAGPWKCPYHNSRALIELINRIS